MTRNEKSTLLALTLGDGCVKLNGRNKKSGILHINHSAKQRMYAEWKQRVLQDIFPKRTVSLKPYTTKSGYDCLTLAVCDKYFRVLRNYLYRGGEKRIKPSAVQRLTPLGLAILYLDDGSLLKRKHGFAVRLHLSLYEHEINPIINAFRDTFGVTFTAYKENTKKDNLYLLYISTKEALKFMAIVKPIVENNIRCMRYKIDY